MQPSQRRDASRLKGWKFVGTLPTAKSSSKARSRTPRVSGPGGARERSISESYPIFVSIKGYLLENPKVIVVRKVMRKNGPG